MSAEKRPEGNNVAIRLNGNQVAIRLNGKDETVEAETVLELLAGLAIDPQRRGLAVAINGEVIPRRTWPEHRLASADDVEIVRPLQGG